MKTKNILAILAVLYIIPWFAVAYDWLWYFAWGNSIFHVLGGFFIALLVASYYSSEFGKLSQPFRLFALVGIVMGVAVLWEFYEIVVNALTGNILPGLDDTMKDLLMDTLGGVTGAVFSGRS